MGRLEQRYRVFSAFLKLYPPDYRNRYGQEILQLTADMLDEAPGRFARLLIWSRVLADLPLNIIVQQCSYVGGIMYKDTPGYIKRNGVVAGVMLLPFVGALVANLLDQLVNNHDLYNSWLWRAPALATWILYLPILAFLVAGISYAVYVSRGAGGKTWLKRALNIVVSWPVLVSGLTAFAILFAVAFHDSVHCWVQSPAHVATHLSQTWQCSERNTISLPTVFKRAFEL